MEKDIWGLQKDKDVQVLGLDLWNGSFSQLLAFRAATGVTFPLLMQAGSGSTYGVAGVEYIMVVDQNGIVQGIKGVDVKEVNTLVRVLLTPAPILAYTPKSLYFGLEMQVGQSKSMEIKIQNEGTADLEVTGIETSVPGLLVDLDKLTVAPGQQGALKVTLTPVQEGTLSGALRLTTNDPTQTAVQILLPDLSVKGALLPAIAVAETALDLGGVEVGRAAQVAVTVRNEGQGPLTVTAVRSALDGVSASEQAFTVAPGETQAVTVTVTVSSEGTFSGELEVVSNDPNRGVWTIPLSGTAKIVLGDARADFNGNGQVDFPDFLAFVRAFGGSDPKFDLNDNGLVDFADFLAFVGSFGRQVN